jgi:hypothetical protein
MSVREGADAMSRSEGSADESGAARKVQRTGFADNHDPDAPGGEGDFAEEHSDTTFAGETADGPEHAREPDQPRGRDGLG